MRKIQLTEYFLFTNVPPLSIPLSPSTVIAETLLRPLLRRPLSPPPSINNTLLFHVYGNPDEQQSVKRQKVDDKERRDGNRAAGAAYVRRASRGSRGNHAVGGSSGGRRGRGGTGNDQDLLYKLPHGPGKKPPWPTDDSIARLRQVWSSRASSLKLWSSMRCRWCLCQRLFGVF